MTELEIGVLWTLAFRLPLFAIYCVAIGVAIYRWKYHPRVSAFAVSAFVINILLLLANSWFAWWSVVGFEQGISRMKISYVSVMLQDASPLVSAIANLFIVIAIFRWRGARRDVA
jgi:hypothetical protein